MDAYHKASSEAWKHAKEITGLNNRQISHLAGWLFETGVMVGKATQNAWFIERGFVFPGLLSLIKISEAGGGKFVSEYLSGLMWLAHETKTETDQA